MTQTPCIAQDNDKPCYGRLLSEIGILETRLAEMGFDGDSAYEKRLINQYHDLIHERRIALAEFKRGRLASL